MLKQSLKPKKYHHVRGIKKPRIPRYVFFVLSVILLITGAYLLILTLSPNKIIPISSPIELNKSDDESDTRNRIQIEDIDLEVPYFSGTTPAILEKGVWWRYSDRGNPKDGGNFILSAHRFYLGTTPSGTRKRSPFYHLDNLEPGSKIRVFYEKSWYEYIVSRKYTVKPDAVEIEDFSETPKMTLYTCTLRGSADGRVVIEAVLR